MTTQGTIVVILIGIAYLLWIVSLVRRGRLHVSYAVLYVLAALVTMPIIAIPPLLQFVTDTMGAIFPVSALSLLAFGVLFATQIYLLSQLSILSKRIALIAQHIAIQEGLTLDPPAFISATPPEAPLPVQQQDAS
jgi:hypothetical protein